MNDIANRILRDLLQQDRWDLNTCRRFGIAAKYLLTRTPMYRLGFRRECVRCFVEEWNGEGYDRITHRFVVMCLALARTFSQAEVSKLHWVKPSHWKEVSHIRSDERRRELMLKAEAERLSCRRLRTLAKASQAISACRLSPELAEADVHLERINSLIGSASSKLSAMCTPVESDDAEFEVRTARRETVRECVEQLSGVVSKITDLRSGITAA
jgi:hypothetical protein